MHSKILFSLIAIALASSTWAQSTDSKESTNPTHAQWGISAGLNTYKEPNLMQLKGPEIGLHLRVTGWQNMPNTQFETDFLLGKQRYTSTKSGSINGVTNIETRWRALAPIFGSTSAQEGFSSGLAIHTLWNDLRGQTTTGAGGYERSAVQLWLPVRWASGSVWTIDTGLLVYGRHTSKISQASSSYDDIVNTQRRGQYAQVNMKIPSKNGSWAPFVRYTHLADSDQVYGRNPAPNSSPYWFEPESHRWQIGAVFEFNTH